MTVGTRIKEARKKAGLTQKQLGEKLGLSFQAVAQWENDLRNPKQDTIFKIAAALGVQWYELYGDSPEAQGEAIKRGILDKLRGTPESEPEPEPCGGIDAICAAYDKLNEQGQAVAVERVEELTKVPDYQRPTEDG